MGEYLLDLGTEHEPHSLRCLRREVENKSCLGFDATAVTRTGEQPGDGR